MLQHGLGIPPFSFDIIFLTISQQISLPSLELKNQQTWVSTPRLPTSSPRASRPALVTVCCQGPQHLEPQGILSDPLGEKLQPHSSPGLGEVSLLFSLELLPPKHFTSNITSYFQRQLKKKQKTFTLPLRIFLILQTNLQYLFSWIKRLLGIFNRVGLYIQ